MKFIAIALLCVVAAFAAPNPPTFPLDWTAYEVDQLLQYQGDYTTRGNLMCCSVNSEGCQVQIQGQFGMSYFDFTHNRTRFDDAGSGQTIVTLYDQQMECLVVNDTCQEYCPLQGDLLSPFGLGDNATFAGYKVVNGVNTTDWRWQEVIFKIIVMETSDMYVDFNGNPISEVDVLTPFGQQIGTSTSTWSKFTPGTPDPSLFVVNGLSNCPQSQNCGQSSKQQRRLTRKQFKTWAYYQQQAAELSQ